jgi:hypothetical protein
MHKNEEKFAFNILINLQIKGTKLKKPSQMMKIGG